VKNIAQNCIPDYSKLIGTPYSEKDCWGIVCDFYRIVFNVDLKQYYETVPESRDIAKSIVYDSMKDFVEVKERKFGDLLLIKLFGVESHIAVYLGEGMMLHTSKHSGCLIERTSRWEKLIVGVYRVKYDIT
jgi:cell wall-associated NlpC family hydrolase